MARLGSLEHDCVAALRKSVHHQSQMVRSASVPRSVSGLFSLKKLDLTSYRYMFAGAIGGPLAVFMLTPSRNVMTLCAKETSLSLCGIYKSVFSGGLRAGWSGGMKPTGFAALQFTALGPAYLAIEKNTGSVGVAMCGAGFIESVLMYNVERGNAVITYNNSIVKGDIVGKPMKVPSMCRLFGPGFVPNVGRNIFAMMGIRLLAPRSKELVEQVPGAVLLGPEQIDVSADLISSCAGAVVSMPLNQAFSWAACTPELAELSYTQRGQACISYLWGTYRQAGVRLLGRDLGCRVIYTGLLFTSYRFIERRVLGEY